MRCIFVLFGSLRLPHSTFLHSCNNNIISQRSPFFQPIFVVQLAEAILDPDPASGW